MIKHQTKIIWAFLVGVLIWAIIGTSFNPLQIFVGFKNAVDFASDFWPPDLSSFSILIEKSIETIQIAILGTVLGVIGALCLAPFAARNIFPKPFVYNSVRLAFDIFRGISELIWGLLFVVILGLGSTAGILALFVHELGALGRYYSEAIELIDSELLDYLKTTKSSKVIWFRKGIYPAIKPQIINYVFYYFEHNFRAATILGMIGAGGIGFELTTAIKLYQFDRVSSILIIIIALVVLFDRISALIRKNVLQLDHSA
jgi:phosphonate transport system permease protein